MYIVQCSHLYSLINRIVLYTQCTSYMLFYISVSLSFVNLTTPKPRKIQIHVIVVFSSNSEQFVLPWQFSAEPVIVQ